MFLRDKALTGTLDPGRLEAWFTFREVRQTWLGYSLQGNQGSGLGLDFARALSSKLATTFRRFGEETICRASHLEKLCLVEDGIGRDNISDFTTNLVKGYLCEYTQAFARDYLTLAQRRTVPVQKVVFNYGTETWEVGRYELPFIRGDYVLLTPVNLLTKDEVWINGRDVYRDYSMVVEAVDNAQLRAQLNNYFRNLLSAIQRRDEAAQKHRTSERSTSQGGRRQRLRDLQKGPKTGQVEEAIRETIEQYPELIDYYIRWKEDHGDEAEATADARVRASKQLYIQQVRQLATLLRSSTAFYSVPGSTFDEARMRIDYLKDVIENKGGWRYFYNGEKPVPRESDLHIMFRLTWLDTVSDVNREVNNGQGPSDFEVSRGRFDKTIVEFKLARNTALARNLRHQVECYLSASDAQYSYKVIVYFDELERQKVRSLLRELRLDGDPHVILIDAGRKTSASKKKRTLGRAR
jgi:hypothetical protein